jgi:hypothetical protein
LIRDTLAASYQVRARRQNFTIGIGGTDRIGPLGRADEHNEFLLSGINHVGESALQYRIALLHRQKRKNVGVSDEPLTPPEIDVVGHYDGDDRCP